MFLRTPEVGPRYGASTLSLSLNCLSISLPLFLFISRSLLPFVFSFALPPFFFSLSHADPQIMHHKTKLTFRVDAIACKEMLLIHGRGNVKQSSVEVVKDFEVQVYKDVRNANAALGRCWPKRWPLCFQLNMEDLKARGAGVPTFSLLVRHCTFNYVEFVASLLEKCLHSMAMTRIHWNSQREPLRVELGKSTVRPRSSHMSSVCVSCLVPC